MSNSYRIRTTPGVDKSLKVLIDQEFEYLEILSLKILQQQIYTRQCSDYGVIVGRVSVNNGFGIPNAKVSVFIPLSDEDATNPIISEIYPYKTTEGINEDGYRYNLLPYVPSYEGHAATGTFFDRDDVIYDSTLIQVYDKYYKYTTTTNDSGDYMIFGVPTGQQTLFVDIDLSDIGEFSLTPPDLVRMGIATPEMVNGPFFKSGTNLNVLPQIISFTRSIEVEPLWGQPEICNLGITRTDFDITREIGLDIKPTAVFMGSIISDIDDNAQKANCKPKKKSGNLCSLTTGPGKIKAIRQTIDFDSNGRPVLEKFDMPNGGQVIDDEGTWVIDIPMNLDYVTTNEFGEQVISTDPTVGIPTKGKYRFKVKWNQPPDITLGIRRGNFLVPNIKEYGWLTNSLLINNTDKNNSYAFSLNWDDYGDPLTPTGQQMISEAINCEDRFYEMRYNKVYTVSNLITQFKDGSGNKKYIAIKSILDEQCESTNYKFPTNDAQLKGDFVFSLVAFFMGIFAVVGYFLLLGLHVIAFIVCVVLAILAAILQGIAAIFQGLSNLADWAGFDNLANNLQNTADGLNNGADQLLNLCYDFNFKLCLMSYPDCETCEKDSQTVTTGTNTVSTDGLAGGVGGGGDSGDLTKFYNTINYTCNSPDNIIYSNLFIGFPGNGSGPYTPCVTCGEKSQGVTQVDSNNYIFTSSLTLPNRLNLFNTKGKYFNSTVVPGGGVNQIKVTFDTNLNDPNAPDKFHLDNVICLVVRDTDINKFTVGKLLTFNNPTLSTDPNLTGGTQNVYGNNAITGTTIGTPLVGDITTYTRQVNYADPNNTGNILGPTYDLTATTNTNLFAKFRMDLEYFQVIHNTSIQSYLTNSDTSLVDSLRTRFINNPIYYLSIDSINCATPDTANTPLSCFENYSNQYLVFLVRGVDPNTNKVPCQYDLSKIYGYNNFGLGTIVNGDFYLNIPIQGTTKCTKHDLTNNTDLDVYANESLYFDAYQFEPSSTDFIPFTSTMTRYYSKIDTTYVLLPFNSAVTGPDGSLCVDGNNDMSQEWNSFFGICYYTPTSNFSLTNARGYYPDEPVEGGSLLYLDANIQTSPLGVPSSNSELVSKIYPTISMSFGLGVSGRQIIMRSDRLPSSSNTQSSSGSDYVLLENSNFKVYEVSETGEVLTVTNPAPTTGNNDASDDIDDYSEYGDTGPLLETFQCPDMVPLDCYDVTPNGQFIVKPDGDPCYTTILGNPVMENGCYIMVQNPIVGFLGDYGRFLEWITRLMTIFGACRGMFSHVFTNNWINGTLYMFPFKNNTFFDSDNIAQLKFCTKTIQFDANTNNFYYRCSPYSFNTNTFVGEENPAQGDGNDYNLLFPTTIMDLGAKLEFLGQVSSTNNYGDYIVNKMLPTSYQDVGDILNLFVIGRLVSSSAPGGVYSYFSRPKNMVDADYAQMISINSEFGVRGFDSGDYDGTRVYIYNILNTGAGTLWDSIIGIFFKSNLQDRDYITPKRTILNSSLPVGQTCAFTDIEVFSQEVPFYRWNIRQNTNFNVIFGDQKTNDWETTQFFSYKYQDLDRLLASSDYFRTTNTNQTDYFPGYIYAVDNNVPAVINPSETFWDIGDRIVLVGAPFHFYFGLRQGKSALDKFGQIWIGDNEEL